MAHSSLERLREDGGLCHGDAAGLELPVLDGVHGDADVAVPADVDHHEAGLQAERLVRRPLFFGAISEKYGDSMDDFILLRSPAPAKEAAFRRSSRWGARRRGA